MPVAELAFDLFLVPSPIVGRIFYWLPISHSTSCWQRAVAFLDSPFLLKLGWISSYFVGSSAHLAMTQIFSSELKALF